MIRAHEEQLAIRLMKLVCARLENLEQHMPEELHDRITNILADAGMQYVIAEWRNVINKVLEAHRVIVAWVKG